MNIATTAEEHAVGSAGAGLPRVPLERQIRGVNPLLQLGIRDGSVPTAACAG
jgi:hypothetical protein